MKLDKKVNEFLEENKNITMISFAWSVYWRAMIILAIISFIITIIGMAFK